MVLSNATKRARNISSTIGNGDNKCNGGMKKAGLPPTAGWMRKLNGVQRNYYFRRTVERKLDGSVSGAKSCTKGGKQIWYLNNANSMPHPFSRRKLN
tara:strand:+ start:817 stop:1107 length:291 start_codon:yes stop_codon:yes gene_type:complete